MDEMAETRLGSHLEREALYRWRTEMWEVFCPELEMLRAEIRRIVEAEMRTQRDLFNPFSREHAAQGELFDDGPEVSALSCVECGEPLERTPSGYLCCPKGHGRLIAEESANPFGE